MRAAEQGLPMAAVNNLLSDDQGKEDGSIEVGELVDFVILSRSLSQHHSSAR
jgi:hypothetical protein